MCYLVSCDRGGYPATWLNVNDTFIRLASEKVGGRVRSGRTWREPGGSAYPSISNPVWLELGRDNLQVRSPQGPI